MNDSGDPGLGDLLSQVQGALKCATPVEAVMGLIVTTRMQERAHLGRYIGFVHELAKRAHEARCDPGCCRCLVNEAVNCVMGFDQIPSDAPLMDRTPHPSTEERKAKT